MLNRNDHRSFDLEFPDDNVCLEWLKDQIFPDGIFCEPCGRVTKHHRVRSRKSYSCDRCGHHVHPTAGTIYHKSRTPLTKWFYATYLLSGVDPDIPITELQRELGVTYKTAWRMTHLICGMLADEGEDEFVEDGPEAVTASGPATPTPRSPDESDESESGSARPSGLFRRITRGR
jgi:hypothetical protein